MDRAMDAGMSLYTTLKEIYFSLDDGDRRLLEAFKLSVPRFYLLKHIAENPGITLTRLSELMLTDKRNITRMLKSLEAESLVRRQSHQTDGRAVSLFLTNAGRMLAADALAAHKKFTEKRFLPITGQAEDLLRELIEVRKILKGQLD